MLILYNLRCDVPLSLSEADLKLLVGLRKHIEALTPVLPDKAVVTVGQYTLDSLLDTPRFQEDERLDLFRVYHKKDLEHKTLYIDPESQVQVDTLYEPHYWYDLMENVNEDEFKGRLAERIFDYHKEVLTLVNLSEGSSSGLYPMLHKFLAEREKNTLGTVIFPSMGHSGDALFNAFASVGMITLDNSTPLLLIDQGSLEAYRGVHRMGEALKGLDVVDYLVELLLDKDGFIRDIYKLSRNFGIRFFSPLLATGCSLTIYENFRNILNIVLEQPLMTIDMSTASMIYVLVKAPTYYKDEFTKGKIEYEVSQWLKDSLGSDVPQVCEPIFVEEFGDRVDVVILVGGWNTSPMFRDIYRRIERFSNMNLEQGLYDRQLWEKIMEKLMG
jgi:hypothetical protein